jgi:hypothetical protein
MNAGIITAKGIGRHTTEQGGVRALGSLDAQVGQNAIGQNLLTNRVPEINHNKFKYIK